MPEYMIGTFHHFLVYICPDPGNIADNVAALFGFLVYCFCADIDKHIVVNSNIDISLFKFLMNFLY